MDAQATTPAARRLGNPVDHAQLAEDLVGVLA